MNHAFVAAGWALCCLGVGWIGYGRLVWRLGHRPVGRFLGNTLATAAYLLAVFGAGILWPALLETGDSRYVGLDTSLWWTWPRAFGAAGILGALAGATITWGRRLETYRSQVAAWRPWLDASALEIKALAEAEGDDHTCRGLAAELLAESKRRREPLPRDLDHFVRRYPPHPLSRPDV